MELYSKVNKGKIYIVLLILFSNIGCKPQFDLEGDYWVCDKDLGYVELSFCNGLMHFYNGISGNALDYHFDGKTFTYGYSTDTSKHFEYSVKEFSDSIIVLKSSEEEIILNRLSNNEKSICNTSDNEMDNLRYQFMKRKELHYCSRSKSRMPKDWQ